MVLVTASALRYTCRPNHQQRTCNTPPEDGHTCAGRMEGRVRAARRWAGLSSFRSPSPLPPSLTPPDSSIVAPNPNTCRAIIMPPPPRARCLWCKQMSRFLEGRSVEKDNQEKNVRHSETDGESKKVPAARGIFRMRSSKTESMVHFLWFSPHCTPALA